MLGMTLNLVYLLGEAVFGVLSHSLALLADAGHNLSDVLALGVAWVAASLGQRRPSRRFTYGLKRSSVIAALANAVALLLVTGGIAWEAILRLFEPEPVAGMQVMIVAAVGILVNGGTALLFVRGGQEDINLRAVFLHMLTDALASLAVVVAGAAVFLTKWYVIDPITSLLLSILIVAATWSLLKESLAMALDGVPKGVDFGKVEESLRAIPGVNDLHDLHIWSISTTETALTAHLVCHGASSASDGAAILTQAQSLMQQRFKIIHTTFQLEDEPCGGCVLDGG
jgi:cobalt-zinc-cadmium efflux system protein